MLEPRTTVEEVSYRQLSAEEWERLRQHVMRRAQDQRARALRDFAGHILSPLGTAAARLAASVAATTRRWRRAYATWRERREAVRELSALDDRALKDFGLHRSEIELVVYGRNSPQVTERKIAAFLFHKPYDRPSKRRGAKPRSASKQQVDKHAA